MFYVYRIQSIRFPEHGYTGYTNDLRNRLRQHNQGINPSTEAFRPWRIVFYAAFDSELAARAFERYLKSGSGKAFARRRLWSAGARRSSNANRAPGAKPSSGATLRRLSRSQD